MNKLAAACRNEWQPVFRVRRIGCEAGGELGAREPAPPPGRARRGRNGRALRRRDDRAGLEQAARVLAMRQSRNVESVMSGPKHDPLALHQMRRSDLKPSSLPYAAPSPSPKRIWSPP